MQQESRRDAGFDRGVRFSAPVLRAVGGHLLRVKRHDAARRARLREVQIVGLGFTGR
jgi:hypothetical protein